MNLSWNQLAKTANQLAKQAQKRIDTVLDIKDDGEGSNDAGESSGQVGNFMQLTKKNFYVIFLSNFMG